MLLSMLLSFVSSRLLRGKWYVPLMLAFLIPASFLSIGVPQFRSSYWDFSYTDFLTGEQAILLDAPFPFSFPVYASVVIDRSSGPTIYGYYRLFFFNYVLNDRLMGASGSVGFRAYHFPAFYYVLYFSFFMLINVFGAMIGYWLGKSAFIDRRINSMKQRIHTRIPKRET